MAPLCYAVSGGGAGGEAPHDVLIKFVTGHLRLGIDFHGPF